MTPPPFHCVSYVCVCAWEGSVPLEAREGLDILEMDLQISCEPSFSAAAVQICVLWKSKCS